MAYIVIENGALQGQRFEITESLIIGRHSSCNVVVRTPGISRRHCRISYVNNKYILEDMESRNGTYLNGEPVKSHALVNNDIINISSYIVRFLSKGDEKKTDNAVIFEEDKDKQRKYDKSMSMESPFSAKAGAGRTEGRFDQSAEQIITELEKRLDNLYQVTHALSSTTDEDKLFDQILECLLKVFPQAERGLLMTGNDADKMEISKVRYRNPDRQRKSSIRVSKSVIRDVLSRRHATLISDTAADEQFGAAVSIIAENICSMMCAPLISQGMIYGILQIENTNVLNPFTEKDLNNLVGVAVQAALFMHNAKLARDIVLEGNRRAQLQRFFSPAVANEVMNNKLKLGGEIRHGITMFCDIVGFTTRSEKNSAEEVIKHLNQYFGVMVGIILAEKGTIDKFGGDAIMAIWGAPVAVDNDVGCAVSCCLQMQNAIVRFNQDLSTQGSDPVAMGIGLHAGSFIAGNIGSHDRMEYTVIGDDVNIAARVETLALGHMLMGSESLVRKSPLLKILGLKFNPVNFKGKTAAFSLTSIRGMKTEEGYLLSIPVTINHIHGKITFCTDDISRFKFVGGGGVSMGSGKLKFDAVDFNDDNEYPIIITQSSEDIFYDFVFDSFPPIMKEIFDRGVVDTKRDISWHR